MFACSQGSGFYRSTNGGTSWTKITTDPQAYDIKFKPGDPKTVYAAGSHFHISTDGGLTFETISKGEGNPNLITITAPSSLAKGYLFMQPGSTAVFILIIYAYKLLEVQMDKQGLPETIALKNSF